MGKALDAEDRPTAVATRAMTVFKVQAAVSGLEATRPRVRGEGLELGCCDGRANSSSNWD
jgi:hypothetical protein